MIITHFRKMGRISALVAVVTMAATGSAWAATCTPNIVEYSTNNNTPTPLLIQCGGTNFFGPIAPVSNCAAQSIETLKIWTSLAQAALLSGKKLNIYTKTCGSGSSQVPNVITGIDLGA